MIILKIQYGQVEVSLGHNELKPASKSSKTGGWRDAQRLRVLCSLPRRSKFSTSTHRATYDP